MQVDVAKEVKEEEGSDVSRMRSIFIQLKTESLEVGVCNLKGSSHCNALHVFRCSHRV